MQCRYASVTVAMAWQRDRPVDEGGLKERETPAHPQTSSSLSLDGGMGIHWDWERGREGIFWEALSPYL